MGACFALSHYSLAKEYWEFFIPHIIGFAETGFIFCIVVTWTMVPKKLEDLPIRASVPSQPSANRTIDRMMEIKVL
jgi:hypothetical protein